ncbi:hypothetical protein DYB38_009954 [Aphanomyces astaci]|uniref:Uncharacterized protein n=1 Tax=Aphanomyces astaci TaxID=112090 RepID=A0A396ZT29_APHAT|nr:hypothetical protein DYB36_010495 [Aphanomyces astaci]RHY41136.1 hypothetical protein DYB38_009954 [Aphanomyces astaci]
MAAPQFPLDPGLAALIILEYDGDRNANHCFHGHGHATFINGQVYEGEFWDGRMHGRGRLEWPDGVVYEGDFEYNEISGSGKYVWPDESWYEGAVKGGKRHGHGYFQSSNKITTYEGEWVDGKQDGLGRMVYDEHNGIEYDGEWKAGVRDGHGTMKYGTGNVYEGRWANGVKCGQGTMHWFDKMEKYDGGWLDDKQHGHGVHVWKATEKRGNRYEGEFADGVRDGYGIFYYANGARYEGHWDTNVKNGLGLFFFEDGTIYEGEFVHDRMVDLNDNRKQSSDTIPTILLYVDDLLRGDEKERARGLKAVQHAVLRVNTDLRNVYRHYASCAGTSTPHATSENNVLMEMRELWRFAVECRLNASMGKLNRKLLVVRNAQNKAVKRLRVQRERKAPIEALEIQVHSIEMQTVFHKFHESLELVYLQYAAQDGAATMASSSTLTPENDIAMTVRSFVKLLQDYGVLKQLSIRDTLKAIRKAYEVEVRDGDNDDDVAPQHSDDLDPFAMDSDMIYPEFLENLTKVALVICPRNLPLPVITAQFIKSNFDDVLFPKRGNRRHSTLDLQQSIA